MPISSGNPINMFQPAQDKKAIKKALEETINLINNISLQFIYSRENEEFLQKIAETSKNIIAIPKDTNVETFKFKAIEFIDSFANAFMFAIPCTNNLAHQKRLDGIRITNEIICSGWGMGIKEGIIYPLKTEDVLNHITTLANWIKTLPTIELEQKLAP